MRWLPACFGGLPEPRRSEGDEGSKYYCSGEERTLSKLTESRRACSKSKGEKLNWIGLVPLLTNEASHADWWDVLQCASVALVDRFPADHASIFLMAGAGVAALSCTGSPLFGVRLGQLLLPGSYQPSAATSSVPEQDSSQRLTGSGGSPPELDVLSLAAALQDQGGPMPIVFYSQGIPLDPFTINDRPSSASLGAKRRSGQIRDESSATVVAVVGGSAGAARRRHYVAVGIPGGKSMTGMLVLSVTGPDPPSVWSHDNLRVIASLLSPLLRPPQIPLTRRCLAEVLAVSTINQLVRAVTGAAAELLTGTVRVAMVPRLALLRKDGSAAAVFSTNPELPCNTASGAPGWPRRSRDVVLVDAGASSTCTRQQAEQLLISPQTPSHRDSLGAAGGGDGCGSGLGTFRGSIGDRPPGHPTGNLGSGAACRGQSLPLQNTLLSEALTRGSGLCIADCNAYVQDSKAYPRDLMLFRGTTPPQSLALATGCCSSGTPLLALYATYGSILPQGLLGAAVQELGQLLRALTPTVATALQPGGPLEDEWAYLHDHLLASPAAPTHGSGRQPTGTSQTGARQRYAQPSAAAPATATAGGPEATMATDQCNMQAAARAAPADVAAAAPALRRSPNSIFHRGMTSSGGERPSLRPLQMATNATPGSSPRVSADPAGAELATMMNAAAAALTGTSSMCDNSAGKRLAAFVSTTIAVGGGACSPTTSGVQGLNRGGPGHASRTSFSLEAAGSPRGGVRLAPLISTLHDRLKNAQAEQLTASSRAAFRIQDLDSLRFLELVGKGGYGSVYRGLYHGSEVAIKVIEDPASSLSLSNSLHSGPTSTALKNKHLHDAIELVASVSMSHPNIVQLITYFVDVRAYQGSIHAPMSLRSDPAGDCHGQHGGSAAAGRAAAHGGNGVAAACDGEDNRLIEAAGNAARSWGTVSLPPPPPVQLVHMGSEELHSSASSCTETSNEAIVLVMEYCDRGSLKDAILEGSFLHADVVAHWGTSLHSSRGQLATLLSRGGVAVMNMKAVYVTLLEVALALRHMHGLHLVHCDLKPQNVLLKSSPRDPRGFTAKLSDFGLAKMMAHDESGQLVIDEGIQSGTITHLPPEALLGRQPLGPAVDVYAFGICMWQLLCGLGVYRGMEIKQVIRGVVRHALRPTFPPWVPAEYRELAQRCWHENPAARPTSLELVTELEAQLGALQEHSSALYGTRRVGSVCASCCRSALAGSSAAAADARRRLPHRCATEIAIGSVRQPQSVGGNAGGTGTAGTCGAAIATTGKADGQAGAAAMTATMMPTPQTTKQPPYYLYHTPYQLYQPSPGATAGNGARRQLTATTAMLARSYGLPTPSLSTQPAVLQNSLYTRGGHTALVTQPQTVLLATPGIMNGVVPVVMPPTSYLASVATVDVTTTTE